MTKLRVVLLSGVNISSELPVNMSSFLTRLDLADTEVYGNLPVSIFEKPDLQYLKLGSDDDGLTTLTGSLPTFNQSNVRMIEHLFIWGMAISGRLPDSIGFMTSLKTLVLPECEFSGPIPDSIGNLTEITRMDLSSNGLSGQVPSTIANLRQLDKLDLSKNHLQGQLPDAFSDLQKLTRLLLGGNGFTGTMPPSLTNMSQLKELDISSNALTGPIPSSFTNMSQLQRMLISSNKLTGPFPSRAGDGLQNLLLMDLSENSIQGTLPSLQDLDLSSNSLTGEIGKFNSESLMSLDLSDNQLCIELHSFYNLSLIQLLLLSHNRVIEQGHEVVNVSLPSLFTFKSSSSEIEEFPKLLRNLSSLGSLDLSNNVIHGRIPSWFSSLQLVQLSYSCSLAPAHEFKCSGSSF